MTNKEVYIIGGPNGAGKTTFVNQYLPKYLHVKNFINADNIAAGISPFDHSAAAIKSGKLMLELIKDLTKSKASQANAKLVAHNEHNVLTILDKKYFNFFKNSLGGNYEK